MSTINQIVPLHDYQVYAKNFAIKHPYCGLFLDMGLGKTSIVLEMLYELAQQTPANKQSHILIVAPKTIARCTWQNEIDKWGIPFHTQSLIVDEKGRQLSKKKREEIYASIPTNTTATMYFINREMVKNLTDRFPEKYWPFKTVILDESQGFKSYNSVRFKAMKSVRPYIRRLILLTGSPTPKGLMDLWSQIYLLDEGDRLGYNITTYRRAFFDPGLIVNGYPVNWIPKTQMFDQYGRAIMDQNHRIMSAEEVIYAKIKDLVISMKNTQLKLPDVSYTEDEVIMDDKEKAIYKQFMKTNVLELASGETISASNAAVLSAKLSQMASGAIYKETGSHEYETIHTHKLEMCEYIIHNTDSPVLIAYHFQSDKNMLMHYFNDQNQNTEDAIHITEFDGTPEMLAAWNKGQIPVMLIQPQSAGFGLNLQDGGHTLIWYTIPWSLEQYEQTNARIYRQGQKHPVIIHHLITKGTIDRKILASIHTKHMTQEDLLDAIEATINDTTD